MSEVSDDDVDRSAYVKIRQVEQLLEDRVREILRALLPGHPPAPQAMQVDGGPQGTKRRALSPTTGGRACGPTSAGAAVAAPSPGLTCPVGHTHGGAIDGTQTSGPAPPTPGGAEDPLGAFS